ncbi:hypothetical protein Sjap_004620 [Stephania japonica]|uniref:Uncharacterized protein n=1 Tax=Stephania japonica TaxID=461633 RepID=A0AAP0K2P1_9MAGN
MSMALFSPPHLPSTLSLSRPNYSSPSKFSLLPLLSKRNLVLLPTKAVNVEEEVTNSAVKVEEKKLDEKDEKRSWGWFLRGLNLETPDGRRKWLIDNPESSSNDDPVVFDTSIIPWWSWVKRFHLPEAELLNDGELLCKTLLFVAVLGVLLIRKNEDIETLKKILEETTFYDKQWQATWQDETASSSKD